MKKAIQLSQGSVCIAIAAMVVYTVIAKIMVPVEQFLVSILFASIVQSLLLSALFVILAYKRYHEAKMNKNNKLDGVFIIFIITSMICIIAAAMIVFW